MSERIRLLKNKLSISRQVAVQALLALALVVIARWAVA